jgi:hypothetical protein
VVLGEEMWPAPRRRGRLFFDTTVRRRTGRQADMQAGRQEGRQAVWQAGRQAGRTAGRTAGRKAGEQAGRQAGATESGDATTFTWRVRPVVCTHHAAGRITRLQFQGCTAVLLHACCSTCTPQDSTGPRKPTEEAPAAARPRMTPTKDD